MSKQKKLVPVENFSDNTSAEVAKSSLELHGIKSWVFGGEVANMAWIYTNAIGGINLMVKESDKEKATQILKGNFGEIVESETIEDHSNEILCPKCHSSELDRTKYEWENKNIVLNRLGLGFLNPEYSYFCKHCMHSWKE